MEFVFSDKCKVDMDVITDLLYEEKIPYKINKYIRQDYFFDEDDEEDDIVIVEELYNIHCFTDLDHFDFIKHLADKKIADRIKLESFYLMKSYKKKKEVSKKNVQRIHKKNTANPNSKNRNKPKR